MSEETTAIPIAYPFSFAPKPRRKVTYRTFRACKAKTPCGGDCILRGDKAHSYHSCKALECQACHGNQRFRFGGKR